MADPLIRNAAQEAALASISLAGVRPLVNDTVTVNAGNSEDYVVADQRARRLVIYHLATGGADIRFDLNSAGAATASDFPIAPNAYFVLHVAVDDVVRFYNTSGGNLDVYVLEIP